VTLRTLALLDALQPGTAGFFGTICNGDPPLVGHASLLVEVAPAMAVHALLDRLLKATACVAGWISIEREFGIIELHSADLGQVREAEALVRSLATPARPRLAAIQRITGVDPQHAQLVDRVRHGDMLFPGHSLLVVEIEPAGYALLAANEAEKVASVRVLEVLAFGAFGRVWLSGDDASMRIAEARIRELA
jgi:hypothetical protein